MRIQGAIAIAVLMLGAPGGEARANVLTGLSGYWQFNGNGYDSSGNGNTLAASGGANFGAAGLFGQALSLDGVEGSSAFLNGSSSAFDLGTGDFTIQVWANLTSVLNQESQPGVLIEDFTGESGPGWTLYYGGGAAGGGAAGGGSSKAKKSDAPAAAAPAAAAPPASGGGQTETTSSLQFYANGQLIVDYPFDPDIGSWQQFVIERASDEVTLYIDGEAVATEAFSGSVGGGEDGLIVGARNSTDGRDFTLDGSIDETAIWDRSLSARDINALWNGGAGLQLTASAAAGAVPELGAWVLMLIGFCGVALCGLVRARKNSTAIAVA